jgi:hypothetical protein
MANRRQLASPSSLQRRQERLRKAIRRQLQLETLEDRRVFASPQLVSINPNTGDFFNIAGTGPGADNLREVAPKELTFRFADGQIINPARATAANFIVKSAGPNGTLGNADDITITPGYVGIGEAPNEVVLRFQENLADDKYRITLVGAGATPIANLNIAGDPVNDGTAFNGGVNKSVDFELDLGAQVIAIVPQPMVKTGGVWTQQRDKIEVYFNNDDLDPTKATNPAFYRLYFTNDTVQNTDDNLDASGLAYLPSVTPVYDANLDKVTLTFSQLTTKTGTFRLRIGTNESAPLTPQTAAPGADPGSSFATANANTISSVVGGNTEIGLLTNRSQIISSNIDAQPFPLLFPGAFTEPGHREVADSDPHTFATPDQNAGTPVFFYNFASPFGTLAGGPAFNLLAEPGADVKEVPRVQEALDTWGKYLGVKFVQTNAVGDGILTIAKGDPRAFISNPWTIVLDAGRTDWNYDYGENWFENVLQEIGSQIKGPNQGLTGTGDLPPGLFGGSLLQNYDNQQEPVFPTQQDIVHGQYLWRPDSIDIDLYKFHVAQDGVFTAETFAERLSNSSALDTVITVFRETTDAAGFPLSREMIARNDDYFSEDSFLRLDLKAKDSAGNPYNYYIGVSASGGSLLDPNVPDSTMGGTSMGQYDLRLNFRDSAFDSLSDIDNNVPATPGVGQPPRPTKFDGDMDGTPGGVYNHWFRVASVSDTIFVDKATAGSGTGTTSSPYRELDVALAAAKAKSDAQVAAGLSPNVTVRVLPNGTSAATSIPYQVGTSSLNTVLEDGKNVEVPRGVSLVVDAGVLFKMRASRFVVGSTGSSDDQSRGSLQVLGTPALTNNTAGMPTGSVFFTSYDDDSLGGNTNQSPSPALPGNWGGIVFQNDRDHADQRYEFERNGIFVNYVNHADIRYGGGQAILNSGTQQPFAPIHMIESRPTLTFNRITLSADAAMSADPDSFEETNFHAPNYQLSSKFTADYDRVGPDIYGNIVIDNSLNGLFVRISTPSGGVTKQLTVAGRFDDLDITHVIKENLLISGTAGGGLAEVTLPPIDLVTLTPRAGGTLQAGGTYNYRITWVDSNGTESPASIPTTTITLTGTNQTVRLGGLPPAPAGFVARRIYRSEPDGTTPYTLVAQINPNSATFDDNGTTLGGLLNTQINAAVRSRLDGSLVIDPGIIVKMDGARIETGFGANFIAEGNAGQQIIFTTVRDDRYGAGGTFDVTGGTSPNTPAFGDWAGILADPTSSISLDNVVIAYGGGVQRVGGTFVSYNALAIHQADARVTNSIFEFNATGLGGQGPVNRFGAGFNEAGTIFVRDSQPIIVDNIIRNNRGSAININANSLNHYNVVDVGRSSGPIDRFAQFGDNQGPLIRLNRLLDVSSTDGVQINGMEIRGETLRTESVWDDTDIVHVLFETIYIPDFHTFGGLRLESSATERLVVKLQDSLAPVNPFANQPFPADGRIHAGFSAMGRPLDIDDRIGGMLHIVGQPGLPVILTSLRDDTVGAGVRPDGKPQNDTNGDGTATRAAAGDWRSVRLDQFSHDRNVEIVTESEPSSLLGVGVNGAPATAQLLGQLAPNEKGGDENRRLGYSIQGFISNRDDVDVYTFIADAGTEVWFDIDRTSASLDTVVELISEDGVLRASSENSYDESNNPALLTLPARTMQKQPPFNGEDHWSQNVKDSGMRLLLPGPQGTTNTYHIRVRSRTEVNQVGQTVGVSTGIYKLQIRLREMDEEPGSTVRFADIRYARTGVEVFGMPGHSPLITEVTETGASNDFLTSAISMGDLRATDRATLAIAGALAKVPGIIAPDVDFYRFTTSGYTSFDMDYADGIGRANTRFWVFDAGGQIVLTGDNSNVSDDRPGPTGGTNLTDLSRGTVGSLDPYVGTAFLPLGTYYVAVAGQGAAPAQLSTNTLLRLEPILASRRLVEDHIGSIGGSTDLPPITPAIINGTSVVPFNLGDVTLFVSEEILPNLGIEQTRLSTIDAFTGVLETMYGGLNGTFPYDIGDMALRLSTGDLNALRLDLDTPPSPRDSVAGNYLNINTGTGQATIIGDDNILTYELGPGGIELAKFDDLGYGVHFDAMSYQLTSQGELLYAVGHRGDNFGNVFNNGPTIKDNILYGFLPGSGTAIVNPAQPRIDGAGTDAIEIGEVLVAPRITVPDPTIVRRNPVNPTLPLGEPPALTYYNESMQDGQTFNVVDGNITTGFEFDLGYEVRQNIIRFPSSFGPIQTVEDGDFFVLNDGGNGSLPDVFQFDAGIVLEMLIPQGQSTADGYIVTVGGPGTSRSFEFNYKAVLPPGAQEPPPRDVTAKQLDFSTGTTTQQLAALLADAINGETALGVGATAVGTRITMTNERFVTINPAPGTPLNWISVVGDFGEAPVMWVQNPALINDGDTFTVNVGLAVGSQNVVFEFDRNGIATTPNARVVSINAGMTANQVVDQIVAATLSTADGVVLTSRDGGDKVAINGKNISFVSSTANINGIRHLTPRLQIPVEESFTDSMIGAAVKNFVNPLPIYEVGAEAGRINFHGSPILEVTGVPVWTKYSQAAPGVASNNAQIKFYADDTPASLALRIEQVIDATFANPSNPANPINSASTLGNFVRLDHGDADAVILNANDPFRLVIDGEGPGGIVTGMATVQGQIYAVTNRGGLYRINPGVPTATPGVSTQFVQTARDDLDGINFQALTAGPTNVENGRYVNMMFGMSETGRLYAFDTTGVLQPVFVNGASSLATGRTDVRGIAFGNLDTNLWHQTGNRGLDLGHGIEDTFDFSRLPGTINNSYELGGTSMYFGAEPQLNYNFAGGAYGTVVSEEFSLKGYSPLDAPTLYFNYLVGNGGATDTFRVFVGDNTGIWTQVSNNAGSTPGWLQARVSLAGFAGRENLRLRFDVSTAGDMNVGDSGTTGDELRTVDARYIEDGDIVTIDSGAAARNFEFEMGQVIVPPSGAGIVDGQRLQVRVNTNPPTLPQNVVVYNFEFDSNSLLNAGTNVIRIPFNQFQTSEEVARNIQTAFLAAALPGLTVFRLDNKVNVKGMVQDIVDVLPASAPPFSFSGVTILGNVGVALGNMPVDINITMNRDTVANVLDAAIEHVYAQQSFRLSDGSNYFDEQTFQLIDNRNPAAPVPYTFEIDTGFVLQVPDAGMDPVAGLADGDTFTITDGVNSVTYEFDTDAVPNFTAGRQRIVVSPNMTQPGVAQAIAAAIDATPILTRNALALDGTALGNGRVQLSSAAVPPPGYATTATPFTTSNSRLTQTGLPGVAAGNTRVYVQPTFAFKANQVAANVRAAINSIPALNTNGYTASLNAADQARVFINRNRISDPLLQLVLGGAQTLRMRDGSQYQEGQTFQFIDTSNPAGPVTYTFELDSGYILEVPPSGMGVPGGMRDGDTFTISDNNTTITYEFEIDSPPFLQTPTHRGVYVSPTSTQAQVAQAIAQAINATGFVERTALALRATILPGGKVQISGPLDPPAGLNTPITISNLNLKQSGIPGVGVGNYRVYFSPLDTYTGDQIAANVRARFNAIPALNANYIANVNPLDPAQLRIVKVSPPDPDLTISAAGVADAVSIIQWIPQNISKQHLDLIRIIGHTVTNQGSMGLENDLDGDVPGSPIGNPNGFNSIVRAQANAFEGFYFDDIMIGFAERGEMYTAGTADASFNIDPILAAANDQLVSVDTTGLSPYQLEIRHGEEYGLTGSINTNDRLNQSYQLTGLAGGRLVDGQSFVVGDGINQVRFEFDDTLIFPTNGVTAGSIRIPFDSQLEDWQIAARIRDAINGAAVQAIIGVSATTADQAHTNANFSTSNLVNLLGPAVAGLTNGPNINVVTATNNANLLRNTILGPGITTVGNAVLVGGNGSAGIFNTGSGIGIDSGIILSTGNVFDAEGPNTAGNTTGIASFSGDPQLDATFGVFTEDTTSLQFQFQTTAISTLQFDFVFASEEYTEFVNSGFNDVFAFYIDGQNIALVPSSGPGVPISIDTINSGLNSVYYNDNDPAGAGPYINTLGYDGFTDVLTAFAANLPAGIHTLKMVISDVLDTALDSAVFVRANSLSTGQVAQLAPPTDIPGRIFDSESDTNTFRDQGQILIHSNTIRDSLVYGINVDAGQRYRPDLNPFMGTLPHAGAARVLRDTNNERLAPGVVIENNIVARSATAGIHFSGDSNNAATQTQQSILPFGRIVNNTVYSANVGIEVQDFAAPTVLNNIVANTNTGVSVDNSSGTVTVNGIQNDRTILGGMLFQGNTVNNAGIGLGDFPIVLNASDPLFIAPGIDNFYLQKKSLAIDSSVESLEDRANLVSLRSPLAITPSPILAPDADITGQLRVDDPDVAPPLGLGSNVFKDRGAVDRVDFAGPTALLVNPLDNGVDDSNPLSTAVTTARQDLTSFRLQLTDGLQLSDPVNGSGIDDTTVAVTKILKFTQDLTPLTTGGETNLILGVHYTYSYDATNNVIILTPLTGIWQTNASYVIVLDNTQTTGIKDLAGNPLKANQLDLSTTFTINIGTAGSGTPVSNTDFGDAPDTYDTSLPGGARHTIIPEFRLGSTIDAEPNGQPGVGANGDDQSGTDADNGAVFTDGSQLFRGRNNAQVTVTSQGTNGDGFVNAWLDFNRNGTFDTGEQIATNVPVVSGVGKSILFNVPANASIGTTYARFRLSKEQNLSFNGPALNGEVEDYAISIVANPYLNPVLRYDVSGDNRVTPLDALLVINRLNSGAGLVGTAPPYLDVTGDGTLSALDALEVINYLNARGTGEGEAASVDVHPVAAASNSGDAVAAATGTAFTSDEPTAAAAPTIAPLAVLPPVLGNGSNSTSKSTASEPAFDYGDFAAADPSFLPYSTYEAADDSDDDLDAILGGSNSGESADDFFAWFGQ